MIDLIHHIASSTLSPICPGIPNSPDSHCGLPSPAGATTHGPINEVLQVTFGIIGAIALLVITIAGLRYITSAGDPQRAANARSTIIFALVGLAIAISAEAIINFVVNRIT